MSTTEQPSFVSARKDAWHNLGPVLPDTTTAEEAMKFGRLSGWNVRKTPLQTQVGTQTITVPGMHALVRDNPWRDNTVDVLATASPTYKILQNEDHTGLLNLLAADSGATYDAAGELDGGRQAFLTLRLPGTAKVGTDKVENYLAIVPSHDSDSSTRFMVTPVRVANQTTLNLAFQAAPYQFKIRHTVGAHLILAQQAKEALEFTFSYLDAFQEEADRLLAASLTQGKFEQLIHKAFGAPKGAPAPTVTRTQNKLDLMAELFSDTFSQGVGGTAWAGLVALAEWSDHHSHVRAGGGCETTVRSTNALMDPAFKNKALKLMLQVA